MVPAMNDAEFWELIDGAASPTVLHDRLARLSTEDLVAFERHHDRLMRDSYRWDLWGAAYVINGGCGDDEFDYFRAYLISRGRSVFEGALADPDTLADVQLADADEWEDWMSPTMAVVHARTGRWEFAAPPDPNRQTVGEPLGQKWDEEDLP